MRIQTIIERVRKFKSFVHGEARLEEHDDRPALVIQSTSIQQGAGRDSGRGGEALAG
jgi:hypothetical protein